MKIRDVDKVCIVDIAGKTVSQSDLIELKRLFKKEASFKQKLSLFNANNEVYLLLFVSKTDRYVNIYLNENDFYEDKHCIVYRRLKLLKSA